MKYVEEECVSCCIMHGTGDTPVGAAVGGAVKEDDGFSLVVVLGLRGILWVGR